MALRIKNFNILVFIEKSDFQRGDLKKNNKEEGLCKKGGLDSLQI